jgi:hypothetical protein
MNVTDEAAMYQKNLYDLIHQLLCNLGIFSRLAQAGKPMHHAIEFRDCKQMLVTASANARRSLGESFKVRI